MNPKTPKTQYHRGSDDPVDLICRLLASSGLCGDESWQLIVDVQRELNLYEEDMRSYREFEYFWDFFPCEMGEFLQ